MSTKFCIGLILNLMAILIPASAQEVLLVDVRQSPQTERLVAATAQGIANRTGPKVFLLVLSTDEKWQEWYESRFNLRFRKVAGVWELIKQLRSYIKGYVVFDPTIDHQVNVALTLAGQKEAIVVTPSLVSRCEELKLPRLVDLRDRFREPNPLQIYGWLFGKLFPQSAHDCIANNYGRFGDVRTKLDDVLAQSNTIFIRFEDATKHDGMGAKLRELKILAGEHTLVDFTVGTELERKYLVDADGSWFDPQGDRIADKTQHFTYRFELPVKKAVLLASVRNQYEIKAGVSREGRFKTLTRNDKSGAFSTSFADYCVYRKAASIDLSSIPNDGKEYALKDKFYRALEPWAQVFGWTSPEGIAVTHTSKRGLLMMCCGATNFSFHASVKTNFQFKHKPPREKMVLDRSKVYVTYILSDGDALHWIFRFQGRQWFLPERGKIPFGWELQPLLRTLAPAAAQYFYETATPNDYMVASASGLGYVHPQELPPGKLQEYLRKSKRELEALDQRVVTVLSNRNVGGKVIGQYGRVIGDFVLGCQEGYAARRPPEWFADHGLSWARSLMYHGNRYRREQVVEDLVQLSREHPQRPLFIPFHLFCYSQNIADAKWWTDHLPQDFVVVRPDQFFRLLREAIVSSVSLVDVPTSALVPKGGKFELSIPIRNNDGSPHNASIVIRNERVISRAQTKLRLKPWSTELARLAIDDVQTAENGRWKIDLQAGNYHDTARISIAVFPLPIELSHQKKIIVINARPGEKTPGRAGQSEKDSTAIDGAAKHISMKEVQTSLHVVYGPYLPLQPGRYVAVYLMRAEHAPSSNAVVAILDVVGAPGGSKGYAIKEVKAQEIAGTYRPIVLPFKITEEEPAFEQRVLATGSADLWIDHVAVLRVRD